MLVLSLRVCFFRSLTNRYKQHLGLDSKRIPSNTAGIQFAEAMSKAWDEYNNPRLNIEIIFLYIALFSTFKVFVTFNMFYRAAVMFVVQTEERNMYDQHWLSSVLSEKYPFVDFLIYLKELMLIYKHFEYSYLACSNMLAIKFE